ncbi:MAG: YbjN domain-containing protein [Myxococcales bacterium]|nr:YbjN domain-containing protein [Myxococcales bacterium]
MGLQASVKKIEGLLGELRWPVISLGPGTWRSSFRGKTTVFPLVIQVQPQGDRAWCKLAVLPVVRLPADPEKAEKLYARLLRLNGEMLLSRFSLDEDGDVILSVEFPIGELDPSELRDSLDVLSVYAERHHVELRQLVA